MTAAPIEAPETLQAAPAEAAEHIDTDVRCLHCGYNLRGVSLAPGGACPECGMPIAVSLRTDRMAGAPHKWLATLRLGATLFEVGAWLSLPLLYLGVSVSAIGLWLVTIPQPGRPEPSKDERQRWAARALMFAASPLLLGLVGTLGVLLLRDRHALFQIRTQTIDIVFIAGHAMVWQGLFFFSAYVNGLAARIPSPMLTRVTTRFRHAWLAGVGAMCLIAVAASFADRILYRKFNLYEWWATPVFAVLVAAVLVYLWIETIRFARTLRRELPCG